MQFNFIFTYHNLHSYKMLQVWVFGSNWRFMRMLLRSVTYCSPKPQNPRANYKGFMNQKAFLLLVENQKFYKSSKEKGTWLIDSSNPYMPKMREQLVYRPKIYISNSNNWYFAEGSIVDEKPPVVSTGQLIIKVNLEKEVPKARDYEWQYKLRDLTRKVKSNNLLFVPLSDSDAEWMTCVAEKAL